MRFASVILIAAVCVLPVRAGGGRGPAVHNLTVILNYERADYSTVAFQSMQHETASIFEGSGVRLDWRTIDQASDSQQFDDLVVFKMKGKCAMDPLPPIPDEMGLPFAVTYTTDGEPLPFGAVDCDRVRQSLKRAFTPADYSRGDLLFGRALGRVIAHELYHMLARSAVHAKAGVTERALSGDQLCHNRLGISEQSLAAIRRQLGLIQKSRPTVPLPQTVLP
jgi:hypothetical protein